MDAATSPFTPDEFECLETQLPEPARRLSKLLDQLACELGGLRAYIECLHDHLVAEPPKPAHFSEDWSETLAAENTIREQQGRAPLDAAGEISFREEIYDEIMSEHRSRCEYRQLSEGCREQSHRIVRLLPSALEKTRRCCDDLAEYGAVVEIINPLRRRLVQFFMRKRLGIGDVPELVGLFQDAVCARDRVKDMAWERNPAKVGEQPHEPRDTCGFVTRPVDPTAYFPRCDILAKHGGHERCGTDKKLTTLLERHRQTIRQWKPNTKMHLIHLGDWLRFTPRAAALDDDGWPGETDPSAIEAAKARVRRERGD